MLLSRYSRFIHPLNILFIEEIEEELKFDKTNDCNLIQPSNILSEFCNKGVIKFDKSININSLHP